jgi:hypothetical protein
MCTGEEMWPNQNSRDSARGRPSQKSLQCPSPLESQGEQIIPGNCHTASTKVISNTSTLPWLYVDLVLESHCKPRKGQLPRKFGCGVGCTHDCGGKPNVDNDLRNLRTMPRIIVKQSLRARCPNATAAPGNNPKNKLPGKMTPPWRAMALHGQVNANLQSQPLIKKRPLQKTSFFLAPPEGSNNSDLIAKTWAQGSALRCLISSPTELPRPHS